MKKFYITTPIYYINDVPHIGHTCTTVVADIIARWHRQKGDKVFFLTGTDEHGQKVAEAAEKAGLKPQEYCDKIAPSFEKAWKGLDVSFDYFIRTTNPQHKKVVTGMLKKIFKKGDIYKGKYEGKYCIGCEKFLTESDLKNGKCPLHPPEKTVERSEENWFFKLRKYVPDLIELIESDEGNYIFPEGKKREVLSKLKAGVKDISFTREKVEWGISAPWDKSQTIYVWIDALINYYSAVQFVEKGKGFWPPTIHLLGKEIIWFHTVIWQAMLLSAGIKLPKKTYVHSFYMIDGQKMSKSLGNVISPKQLKESFGIDGARYLIASSFPTKNDADVGMSRFTEKYNADLANNLGNLVSRVAKLAEGLEVEKVKEKIDESFDHDYMGGSAISSGFCLDTPGAIKYVFDNWINPLNAQINKEQVWLLERKDSKRQKNVKDYVRQIRNISFHLSPFMPKSCKKIENIFEGKIKPLTKSLFPRI